MYNIGTVSTTANSPKITGIGTRWKDNSTLVSVGQLVLIENGSTLIINCIDSIESNTALTLGFPVPVKLTNVKYRILTTMIDSISDGVNKATAQVIASEIFTDIFTELMTGTGIIEFELPNGQKVKLRTENEKNKQLDGKLDKTGGSVEGGLSATKAIQTSGGQITAHVANGAGIQLDATGDAAKIRTRNAAGKWFDHTIPESAGTLTQIGDFGLGAVKGSEGGNQPASSFVSYSDSNLAKQHGWPGNGCGIQSVYAGDRRLQLHSNSIGVLYNRFSMTTGADTTSVWYEIYSTKNTTKDAQGNLRAASPIVKVFADKFDVNDESEGVVVERLGVGKYLIKGVLGLNADRSWGGEHGGIVIPKGINGVELVWANYKVLADGDIILTTHYRKLPPETPWQVVLDRIVTYPEFQNENGDELESYAPCDIPNGHWIDIRVQMPSNSIYNQKQAEAERLAKIEAERLAQEEAKRIAEEAERAEQEAAEHVEQ